jgi:hypothetical protein
MYFQYVYDMEMDEIFFVCTWISSVYISS